MSLKASNVNSTAELLSLPFCSEIHIVSGGHILIEDDEQKIAAMLAASNGYSQTKFISELLIKNYIRRLSPDNHHVSIVKPGIIIGTAREGVSNTDDFIWRVVSSAIKIKGFNAEEGDSWISMAGLDQVAAIVIDRALYHRVTTSCVYVPNGTQILMLLISLRYRGL